MNIGDEVGQYRVTQLLGEGGMGAVYKAVDTMIEREVAIKVLRPEIGRSASLLQRFRAEAVTLAKLNHSGIATLYSFQQHADEFLMIMEYVPGKTLEGIERERGALPLALAMPLFTRILEAIGPAHEAGILHRDIKPANIMLTTWGAVKVMDFGIARIAGAARQTREGALVGTMEYIAPERVKGSEGDIRSDIYALGVVLFEMLTGRLPFESGNEFELMRMHLEAQVPSVASQGVEVPEAVEQLLQKAMAKDPGARFSTCEEFAEAAHAAAGDLKISRGDVVALVGKPVVQELGTAGHHSSISGETLAPVAVQASDRSSPTVAAVGAPPAYAQTQTKAPSSMQRLPISNKYKVPIVASAALAAAIGAGIGVGKLMHHGSAPAVNDGNSGATQVPASSPAPDVPENAPLQPVPTPTTQTLAPVPTSVEPVPIQPIAPEAKSGERALSKPHRQSAHERSMKALEE
jgi:serine/threonine protein kinase